MFAVKAATDSKKQKSDQNKKAITKSKNLMPTKNKVDSKKEIH